MTAEVFILQGERGEYEQRTEETYGVFSCLEEAIKAASEIPRLSAKGYAQYRAFEDQCANIASDEGAPDVQKYILDQTDEDRAAWLRHVKKVTEIKNRIGPAPKYFCTSERYWVTRFNVGQVGSGRIVFDTDEYAVAS